MKKPFYVLITLVVALFFSACDLARWLIPYSFEPSYHEFKKLCELNFHIYQTKGGKGDELDEEYYNKMLAYYELDWNTMLNTTTSYQYHRKGVPIPNYFNYMLYEKWLNNRIAIRLSFDITKDLAGNVIKARPHWSVTWRELRPALEGGGSGLFFNVERLGCEYFYDKYGIKKELYEK